MPESLVADLTQAVKAMRQLQRNPQFRQESYSPEDLERIVKCFNGVGER